MSKNGASTNKSKPDSKTQKRSARLMAVQGVYGILADFKTAEDLIPNYLAHYSGMDVDGDVLVEVNPDMFSAIVKGVEEHQGDLAVKIDAAVGERTLPFTKAREPLLYSILLCAVFEITLCQDTDIPIIISDYLHVAHAFFDGGEPKFVNGVLDTIAKSFATA